MKSISLYQSWGLNTSEEVFDYLLSTLKKTIRTYDFFVAWDKVLKNVSDIEVSLNIMNSLIGKSDIAEQLKNLIKRYPEIVPVIPILIACRESHFDIADLSGDKEHSFNRKASYSDSEISEIVYFAEQCGLLKVLADKNIKNLFDYCIGVEVGLDTNARKNRGGIVMEKLVEVYVKGACEKHGFHYLRQARVKDIELHFGKTIPIDKTDRSFDYAINTGETLFLIETNYYSGGGSKLKAVAGEFINLFSLLSEDPKISFVWVTDGLGWETTKRPLLETFNAIDYVMNVKMLERGLLEEVITNKL